MRIIYSFMLIFLVTNFLNAQNTIDSIQKIDEVVIESQRMALPFQKQSHTISLLSASDIDKTPVTSLEELLQNVVGIDIRRRGVKGMQSDLYIRGGNFNQVLLLIDGIAMNDLQTGHHIMNASLSLENIERIEIIKGAASRIYGQNAMNGAINIITKNWKEDRLEVSLNAGSFENFGGHLGIQKKIKNVNVQVSVQKQQSEGYRFNSDFDNWNAFIKSSWNGFNFLFSYSQRDFGANGFYASPDYIDQYEETKTHITALTKTIKASNTKIKLKTYWRRNEDMYLFLRYDPDFYRNLHKNNTVGVSADATFKSNLGNTGVGIDINEGFITSNNLGDYRRLSTTIFAEHRFQFAADKLDITPGVALSYYSDFDLFPNPGIDLGYRFSDVIKLYANLGYTSRIPTYTNLYYSSPAENGNPNLEPEKALTYEVGVYFTPGTFQFNMAVFNRNTSNLIDWTKENISDKWQAHNIGEVTTKGVETQTNYSTSIASFPQKLALGYTYLDESKQALDVAYSRYSLNSFRHQLSGQLSTQFLPFLQQHISYRFNERIDGTSYQVVDVGLTTNISNWKFEVNANNIFGAIYTETNLVPMPKANYMGTLSYHF